MKTLGSDEDNFFSFLDEQESSIWFSEEAQVTPQPVSIWTRLWRWITGSERKNS